MPAPTQLTYLQKINRSVEYALKQITNANNYYTDGIVVVRGVDPRNFDGNQKRDYEIKRRYCGIYPGIDKPNPQAIGARRKVHQYSISCEACVTPQERASDVALDDIYHQMLEDLYDVLDAKSNNKITAAGVALGYPIRPGDGKPFSLINHRIADVPECFVDYPNLYFSLLCEFDYDRQTSA